MKNVKGLKFTELPGKEQCCGFGGTFSVKMAQISEQMVDEKVRHVEETGAEYLIGADAGMFDEYRRENGTVRKAN